MFRIEDGRDIEDDVFAEIVSPFIDYCNDYLEQEVAPKYAALYLAEGFRRSAIWQSTYDQHLNSALDAFTMTFENKDKIKEEVTNILLNKYGLKVVNEDPLELEEVNYD